MQVKKSGCLLRGEIEIQAIVELDNSRFRQSDIQISDVESVS